MQREMQTLLYAITLNPFGCASVCAWNLYRASICDCFFLLHFFRCIFEVHFQLFSHLHNGLPLYCNGSMGFSRFGALWMKCALRCCFRQHLWLSICMTLSDVICASIVAKVVNLPPTQDRTIEQRLEKIVKMQISETNRRMISIVGSRIVR